MSSLIGILFGLILTLPAVSGSPAAEETGLPSWFWVLMILILVVLPILVVIFGPGLARKRDAEIEAGGGAADPGDHHAAHDEHHALPADSAKTDDLKRIEGIGPKIASVMQAAGIRTFAQLAAADVAQLQQILDQESTLRLADPTTWPQQAHLAAAGDWAALEKLQDELKGGQHD